MRLTAARRWVAILGALAIAALLIARLLPPSVSVARVSRGALVQTVVASGRVRPPARVRLGSDLSGVVTRVLAREGDRVTSGQTLIELDPSEWQGAAAEARAAIAQAAARVSELGSVALSSAEASLRQAEANAGKARADLARAEDLARQGILSASEFEQARQAFIVAESQLDIARLNQANLSRAGALRRQTTAALDQARAAHATAQARLAKTRIQAPADGIVLTRDVEPGDAVQPGRVLMELSLLGPTQLTAEPDERQLALLKIGQVSAASADAYPHERFAARMTYVSPLVDAQRGTIEVRLDVERPPAYLRPDMTVSIEVEVARRSEAVLLPIDAIRASGSAEPWVLVVRDGRIARQAIVIGAQDETRAEVRQGLREGELVVVAPLVALAPGQRVRPRVTAKN